MKLRQLAYQFAVLSMATLVIFSSIGFLVDMHYCEGELKEVALWQEAESCHKQEQVISMPKDCPFHQNLEPQNSSHGLNDGCCQEELAYAVLAGKPFQLEAGISLDDVESLVPAYAPQQKLYSIEGSRILQSLTYRPPPLYDHIHIIVQSFLL